MDRITTAQREYLRGLMRNEGMSLQTVTYMHRRVGALEHEIGMDAEVWLGSLSKDRASKAIAKLKVEEGDE